GALAGDASERSDSLVRQQFPYLRNRSQLGMLVLALPDPPKPRCAMALGAGEPEGPASRRRAEGLTGRSRRPARDPTARARQLTPQASTDKWPTPDRQLPHGLATRPPRPRLR